MARRSFDTYAGVDAVQGLAADVGREPATLLAAEERQVAL